MGDIVDELDKQADREMAEDLAAVVGTYWVRLREMTGAPDNIIMPMVMHFQGALLYEQYPVGGDIEVDLGNEFSD